MSLNRPISIFHLITTLDTGGTETMLLRLLSSMDRGLFSNQVISLTDIGSVGEKLMAQGIPVHTLKMPRGAVTLRGLARLRKIAVILRGLARLRKILLIQKPMILQTWLYHGDLFGLIIGKLAGIRFILWNIRCSKMNLKKYPFTTRLAIILCTIFSSFPEMILTNSLSARKYHTELGYRARRWKIIPNGFDCSRFRPDVEAKAGLLTELGFEGEAESSNATARNPGGNSSAPFLIGFIARFDPMKDHGTFIRAACSLLEEKENIHFVLAGKDVASDNRALTSQIPTRWRDRFHLLGRRDDIEKVTAALDVATLSSHGEGFPNIVCEAMACGIPCVVADVGDSSKIVEDTGKVVPPGDHQALKESWKALIDMGGGKRKELGVAARKRVERYYELSNIVRQYEDLYLSLT